MGDVSVMKTFAIATITALASAPGVVVTIRAMHLFNVVTPKEPRQVQV
jgi:hypothetical protein